MKDRHDVPKSSATSHDSQMSLVKIQILQNVASWRERHLSLMTVRGSHDQARNMQPWAVCGLPSGPDLG